LRSSGLGCFGAENFQVASTINAVLNARQAGSSERDDSQENRGRDHEIPVGELGENFHASIESNWCTCRPQEATARSRMEARHTDMKATHLWAPMPKRAQFGGRYDRKGDASRSPPDPDWGRRAAAF